MKASSGTMLRAALCGVVILMLSGRAQETAFAQQATPAPVLGYDAAVTVLPVILGGEPSKDVADVVGLILEKDGMPNVWTVDAAFKPPADLELDDLAKAVAEFVQQKPPHTEYVLFAEFLGTPQTGLTESRAVLVDKAGRVVWQDRQTPQDADFKRIKPREPMQCCMLLSERLKPVFHLPGPKAGGEEGRMAKLWAEKSGTPSDADRAAMDSRLAPFKSALKTARLAVYPVLVADETNRPNADQLAGLISAEFSAKTQVVEKAVAFKIAPSSNEQKRLWDLARAFRAQLRDNPPDADYALYAEYTIRPADQQVWAVHFVVCNKAGEWVIVDFQNNHQSDFQKIDPKTQADCGRLILRRLHSYVD